MIIRAEANEAADICKTGGGQPMSDCRNLLLISLYTLCCHYVTQVGNLPLEQYTLSWLEFQASSPEAMKYHLDTVQCGFKVRLISNYVIQVC